VLYYTKGSGGNGVNTVYFLDTTGKACPNGVGLPAAGASLPASPLSYDPATLQANGLPSNMCVLKGFPTALKSATSFPFGLWFANADTLYVADEGNGTTTFSGGTYTAAAAQTTAGLQKWVFDGAGWKLAYTLQAGLNLGQPYTVRGYPTGDNAATGLPWAPATDGLPVTHGTMGGMAFDSSNEKLSRQEASDAVTGLGWRYVLGEFRTEVRTGSLPLAADVAGRAAAVPEAQGHLRMDVREDRVLLALQTAELSAVTSRDVELARRISAVTEEFRLTTTPGEEGERTVQALEIGIDAMDIASIRPFWKAVLGYIDEPTASCAQDALVDPFGQGPAIWFQQMDAPRPQRNRLHFDVSVPHDEAHRRIEATIAAGGKLLNDAEAPAFWVLADPEGNEACVTTWQGRD
jgi:4a-hydroxytetrahydrobiopterin dehydratase